LLKTADPRLVTSWTVAIGRYVT